MRRGARFPITPRRPPRSERDPLGALTYACGLLLLASMFLWPGDLRVDVNIPGEVGLLLCLGYFVRRSMAVVE